MPEFDELILAHETSHIKSLDILICWMTLAARSLHWFNPLSHFLTTRFKHELEYLTDCRVMKPLDKKEQEKYGQLILEHVQSDSSPFKISVCKFSFTDSNYYFLKERIKRVKNIMKKHNSKIIPVIVAIICSLLFNAVTILAYNIPDRFQNAPEDDYSSAEFSDFLPDDYENIYDYHLFDYAFADEQLDFLMSDQYFIDENGTAIAFSEADICSDASISRSTCKHVWINGTAQKHNKNADGSCDILYYHSKRCTECKAVILGELDNTAHYAKCPH